MSEWISKCCGAKLYGRVLVFHYFCSKCHKPCKIKKKDKEKDKKHVT